MRYQHLILMGLIVSVLPAASAFGQMRPQPMNSGRVTQASYGSGCSTCGVNPVATGSACGCETASCGTCNTCRPCCRPCVLPAIVRGVDRAVDRVGDALACLFTRPCCNTCETPCCAKPCAPRVYRTSYRLCDDGCSTGCTTGGCTTGGCTARGCTSGCNSGIPGATNPFMDESEAPPVPPKDARNYQLWNMKPPAYGNATRPAATPAAVRPTAYSSPAPRPAAPKTGTPKLAAPRTLHVEPADATELSRGLPEEDVKVKSVRRTSASSEFSSRIPKNPLRD